jgi:MFS-type transporter involved in bile tolerance (Atg22 family)
MTTTIYAILLVGPNQQLETYILSLFFGIGGGWKWTVDRLLVSLIIPRGQDAELMGFFLFSGQILSWIPPLVYTAINEAGISQRIGVASLDIYFLLSMFSYFLMRGYQQARAEVGRDATVDTNSMKSTEGKEEEEHDDGKDDIKTLDEPDCWK